MKWLYDMVRRHERRAVKNNRKPSVMDAWYGTEMEIKKSYTRHKVPGMLDVEEQQLKNLLWSGKLKSAREIKVTPRYNGDGTVVIPTGPFGDPKYDRSLDPGQQPGFTWSDSRQRSGAEWTAAKKHFETYDRDIRRFNAAE